MCVIIHQPRKGHLKKDRAERLWTKNSDGGGFAFVDDAGSLQTKKFMDFSEFWPAFENARSLYPQRDFLVHMRIATHGTVTLDNVHPYVVDDQLVMAHNGILAKVPDYKDGRSDTKVFVDEVLPSLPPTWLDDPYLFDMVEDWIGFSKLMFLTSNPDLRQSVYILNKTRGTIRDGMWFSNTFGLDPISQSTYESSQYSYKGTQDNRYSGFGTVLSPRNGFGSEDRVNVSSREISAGNGTAKKVDINTPAEEDLQNLLDDLKEERRKSFLYHQIFLDELDEDIWCWGCGEAVDIVNGECDCYNKVCLPCQKFAADCTCVDPSFDDLSYYDDIKDDDIKYKAIMYDSVVNPGAFS